MKISLRALATQVLQRPRGKAHAKKEHSNVWEANGELAVTSHPSPKRAMGKTTTATGESTRMSVNNLVSLGLVVAVNQKINFSNAPNLVKPEPENAPGEPGGKNVKERSFPNKKIAMAKMTTAMDKLMKG